MQCGASLGNTGRRQTTWGVTRQHRVIRGVVVQHGALLGSTGHIEGVTRQRGAPLGYATGSPATPRNALSCLATSLSPSSPL